MRNVNPKTRLRNIEKGKKQNGRATVTRYDINGRMRIKHGRVLCIGIRPW